MSDKYYTGDKINYPGQEAIRRLADGATVTLSLSGQTRIGENIDPNTKFTVIRSSMHDGVINYRIKNEQGEQFDMINSDIRLDSADKE